MAVSQLSYIGVGVSDTVAWERFAADVLGMQIGERRDDGIVYLRMDEYHHRVIVHASGEDDVLYVGLQAATGAEFDAAKAKLASLGVRSEPGTAAEVEVRRVVALERFETGGLHFELSFGPAVSYAQPFKPGRAISGFKTGELGVGHIVLRSTERDQSVKILSELGFRISDYVGNMVFLHCNPRHHTVALQPANPNANGPALGKKMWHLMLETNSLDDVGLGFDAATRSPTPPVTTIGKHMNDHMVSFYVLTPSGFEIEYGWGGRLIDDATWEVVHHVGGDIWGHKPMRQQNAQGQPVAANAAR